MVVVRDFICGLSGEKVTIVRVNNKEIALDSRDVPGFEGTTAALDNLSIFK